MGKGQDSSGALLRPQLDGICLQNSVRRDLVAHLLMGCAVMHSASWSLKQSACWSNAVCPPKHILPYLFSTNAAQDTTDSKAQAFVDCDARAGPWVWCACKEQLHMCSYI